MYAQISAVQSQLQQEQEARLADNSERVQLRQRLVDIEQELEQAKDIGTRADGLCGERDAELERVQALLQALESDNKEQVSLLLVNRLDLLISVYYYKYIHTMYSFTGSILP